MKADRSLHPLAFHQALANALEAIEPGLFRWFSSESYTDQYAQAVKLELLRSTYRLPQASNEKLYAMGAEVAEMFQLEAPLTLYQAQEDGALNAGLVFVPSALHVVLRGPVMQTLTDGEVRALFGHELAHHKLWTEASGRHRVAAALVEHSAAQRGASSAHVLSALRHRRWTEIYSDRGALVACDNLDVAISCLVKMTTGLQKVDPQAYLEQALETLGAAAKPSETATHPEPFVRAFALKAWHEGQGDDAVAQLIEGVAEIDTLDLVQQRELTQATRDLLRLVLNPSWMQTETTLAFAGRFFPGATFEGTPSFKLPFGGESVAEYFAYLLLDFGMADPAIEELSMAHVAQVAQAVGVRAALAKVVKKELRLSASSYAELEKRGLPLPTAPPLGQAALARETPR